MDESISKNSGGGSNPGQIRTLYSEGLGKERYEVGMGHLHGIDWVETPQEEKR